MPCNAHNHPPDCNCGWGGIHYEPGNPEYGLDYWKHESSHTNPNAKCPICGEKVFFYRSSEGGAVYFDDLGPPWPKHPCTDPDTAHAESRLGLVKNKGWWPYLMDFIGPLVNNEGMALYDVQDRLLVVKAKYGCFRYDTPIWIQAVNRERWVYRLSTLRTKKGKTVETAYEAYNKVALMQVEYARKFQATVTRLNSFYK